MELQNFLDDQKILDEKIMENVEENLETKELLNNKILALFTEVGEFANELATFKYWKHYHVKDDKKILEEFVDIIFFLLSIANLLEFDAVTIREAYTEKWEKNMERQKNNY